MSVPPKRIVNIHTHDEPVVRLTQVCRYLGVDRRTAQKWVAAGLLRAFQLPGGEWRVEIDHVRAFLDQQRLQTAPSDATPRTTDATG